MEIYLLREEKEVGPYGADDLRSWLDDGAVQASELAWAPGLESWVPLRTILEPEPEAPAPQPVAPRPILKPRPKANAQQRAFLSYMGVSFAPEITADEAERLGQEAGQDPKLAARRARWDEDRLDLHPELFAEELKERRANRPAYFHKQVQTEGGDCFTGVTKAHCQVLIGYLDVNHPRWDAHLRDATWHYFFPAIAEKFPQLVHKEWRPKLKYKEGAKVAPELLEPLDKVRAQAARSRRGQLVSKVIIAVVVLGVTAAGFAAWRSPALAQLVKEKTASSGASFMAAVRGDEPAPARSRPIPKKVAVVPVEARAPVSLEPVTTGEPAVAKTTDPAPAEMKTPDPAPATAEAKPDPKPEMKPEAMTPAAETPAPVAQAKPTESLFNPNANAPAPASVPAAPASVAAPRTEARLTHPVMIPSKYGVVTINTGTDLPIVSRQGDWLTLNHMGQAIRVPVSSTDFAP